MKKLNTWAKRLSLSAGLVITCLVNFPTPVLGQKLRVGVAGSPPFVIEESDKFKGISIEIWKEIANKQKLNYELIQKPRVQNGLEAVANGKLDVLIGPISITSQRLKTMKIEFTQPIFFVQIAMVLPSKPPSLWSRIKPFFEMAAFSSLFGFFLLLFIVGNFIWLAERNQNSQQFPRKYLSGVGNGIWLALVTLTTVGYGDRAPVTRAGRLILGIWMLISLLTLSTITAGLASAFTVSLSELAASEKFTSPADLKGAKIAVVSGTTSVGWGEYYQGQLVEVETLKQAIELVASGQTEGAIFDRPALKYYLSQYPQLRLRLASFSLGTETYGFVVSENNDFLERNINLGLLEMYEKKRIQEIAEKWLKSDNFQQEEL